MKLNEFNILIGNLIVNHISDTQSYANLRQSCQYFYFLMPDVKRFTDNILTEHIKYKEHLVDGDVSTFFPSGKIKSIALYERGFITSKQICWNEKGVLSIKENYKNNKKNGKQYYYTDQGNIEKIIDYFDGKPHGKETTYFTCGLIQSIATYIRGKRNGMQIVFDDQGNKYMTKEYNDGYLCGQLKYFYTDGNLKQITNYTLGMRNGLTKYFDNHGNLLIELNYKNNLMYGKFKKWEIIDGESKRSLLCNFKNGLLEGFYKKYVNGQLYYECSYQCNMLDGPVAIFENGNVKFETYFNMGKLDFYHREYINRSLALNVIFNDNNHVAICKKSDGIILKDDMYIGTTYYRGIMAKYKSILKDKIDISFIDI